MEQGTTYNCKLQTQSTRNNGAKNSYEVKLETLVPNTTIKWKVKSNNNLSDGTNHHLQLQITDTNYRKHKY